MKQIKQAMDILENLLNGEDDVFPSTTDELFKAYLERKEPELPKNVTIVVDAPTYWELQHIKDNIINSYSLDFRFPPNDIDFTKPDPHLEEKQKIGSIENRHTRIICDILDMFAIDEDHRLDVIKEFAECKKR